MRYFCFFIFCSVLSVTAFAHEEIYHLDPVLTEHAHMEYEYILGIGFDRKLQLESEKRDRLTTEVEINYPFTPEFSLEVIAGGGWLYGSGASFGVGDLEIEGRWVFSTTEKYALSVALPFAFPTGDAAKGLSEDRYAIEPTFRADLFLNNVDLYYNVILGLGLDQSHFEVDNRLAATYLWRVSPQVTLSPVAEIRSLAGQAGEKEVDIAGGFGGAWKEWFGVAEFIKPVIGDETSSWSILFHVGYHRRK